VLARESNINGALLNEIKCKFHCHCKPLKNKYEKLSQYLMNQQTRKPNSNWRRQSRGRGVVRKGF